MAGIIVITLIFLIILGIPIAVCLGLAGIIGIEFFTKLPLLIATQRMVAGMDSFILVAVPLFILAGNLMTAGGISKRLVEFAISMVGGIRGGLACSCVITCMIFAAVSGSSVATTYAIGAILIPAMVQHGYPRPTAAAIQASSSELGVLIPPSIPLILYGVATDTSIGQLFIAGIGPGLLVGSTLIIFLIIYCHLKGIGNESEIDNRQKLGPVFLYALPALFMPVIVLGGIYMGIFTPTEASAVAVFSALVIGKFVYKELTLKVFLSALRSSTVSTSVVMLIISAASVLSFFFTRIGLSREVSEWATVAFDNKLSFLITVNIFLFLLGTIIDPGPAILVLAPVLAPIAVSFGVDPVHFGLIMVLNLALGMITPPIGVNLFAACQVGNVSLERMVPALLPFFVVIIFCLMLVTFLPIISIGLRDLLY